MLCSGDPRQAVNLQIWPMISTLPAPEPLALSHVRNARGLQRAKTKAFTRVEAQLHAPKLGRCSLPSPRLSWCSSPVSSTKSLGKLVRWIRVLRREADQAMLGCLDIDIDDEGQVRIHLHAVMDRPCAFDGSFKRRSPLYLTINTPGQFRSTVYATLASSRTA